MSLKNPQNVLAFSSFLYGLNAVCGAVKEAVTTGSNVLMSCPTDLIGYIQSAPVFQERVAPLWQPVHHGIELALTPADYQKLVTHYSEITRQMMQLWPQIQPFMPWIAAFLAGLAAFTWGCFLALPCFTAAFLVTETEDKNAETLLLFSVAIMLVLNWPAWLGGLWSLFLLQSAQNGSQQ